MPLLSIPAHKQYQFKPRQMLHQARTPGGSTFAPWRQVPAFGVVAGKTETHRHDRNLAGIIEFAFVNAHPAAQPHTGWILEGKPGIMGTNARSLRKEADACSRLRAQHRARFMRQRPSRRRFDADPATFYLAKQIRKPALR